MNQHKPLIPLKIKTNFVLLAQPDRDDVRITMPGGETFLVSVPMDERFERLPSDMPLLQRLAIAFGFKKESGNASMLAYDVESKTPGVSPNPNIDELISASVWGDRYCGCFRGNEVDVLEWLIETIGRENPDILAGFFCNRYDMLLMMCAAQRHNIDLALGRDGSHPEVIYRRFEGYEYAGQRFKVKLIKIGGRIHFDVWDEVRYDQSLIGIKSRGLKPVSKFLRIPHIVEVDRTAVAALTPEQLLNYNISDSRLTYILASSYLMNLVTLAEDLDLPLNLVVERTPSHVLNYIYGRDFLTRNIEYQGDNQTRYPQIFSTGGKAYQGGYVMGFRTGIYRPVSKIDFVNLYPGVMTAHNFDPYTVDLMRIDGFTGKIPRYEDNFITVSDSKVGDVTCRVDNSADSQTRLNFIKYIKMKRELKIPSRTDLLARSRYWVVKLILNGSYGYHGLKYAKWGSVPIAIMTTAIGRWYLHTLCDKTESQWTANLEGDTDGIYIGEDISPSEINELAQMVRGLVPEPYDSQWIDLDKDFYEAGLFVDEKNYILKDPSRKELLFHGSGFKGRHIPIICDDALRNVVSAIFEGEDWKRAVKRANILPRDLQGYVMRAEFGKTEYAGNSLYAQLAEQCKKCEIPVYAGDSVRYIKTKTGYNIFETARRKDVDEAYYRRRIAQVIHRALKGIEPKLRPRDVQLFMSGQTRLGGK